MISLLLRSKIAILKKCHIWHHSKKVPYTGCPTNIVMETPCKKVTRNNEKRRYEKKTETEKNRADTILVFLLQHTSDEYRIIFYMCPSFFSSSNLPILNNNSRGLLLRQMM